MTTELRWIASYSASCMHAAWAMLEGLPLTDEALAGEWAEAVQTLGKEIDGSGMPREATLDHLCGFSAGIDNNKELAEVVLRKVVGISRAQRRSTSFSSVITNLEAAYQRAVPQGADELQQRCAPLRSQWQARGPGLLAEVGRLSDSGVLVQQADVVLVYPVLGGGGAAHVAQNLVRIEAVLTDSDDRLPEVLRLCWMLSLLNLDLPRYSENLPAARRTLVTSLAMIPPTLTAAATVQIGQCDLATVTLALASWLPTQDLAKETALALLNWWETFMSGRLPWPVALAALEKMLPAA